MEHMTEDELWQVGRFVHDIFPVAEIRATASFRGTISANSSIASSPSVRRMLPVNPARTPVGGPFQRPPVVNPVNYSRGQVPPPAQAPVVNQNPFALRHQHDDLEEAEEVESITSSQADVFQQQMETSVTPTYRIEVINGKKYKVKC